MIKKIKNKKILILSVIIVVFLSGGAFAYTKSRQVPSETPNDTTVQDGINLDPPTEEEKKITEEHKKNLINNTEQTQPPTSGEGQGQKTVKPTISYAGQYGATIEVGAIVTGIHEDNGTCTAKLSNGNKTITKSVQAIRNVNSTDCPVMKIASSGLSPKGMWSVSVTYTSPSATGSSDSRTIAVR